MKRFIRGLNIAVVVAAVVMVGMPAASASAATIGQPQILEAQQIMSKFSIPTGNHDGVWGPQTARALCSFRYMAGARYVSRAPLDTTTLNLLRDYNARYADIRALPRKVLSNGVQTYLVAQQTCQTMFFMHNGTFIGVMPISTGRAGLATPNGYYALGDVTRGWTCSTEYPETCRQQSGGRFAGVRNYGNMYNKRPFKTGGFYVHGSNTVPTYPDSAGCIRVSVEHADYIYDHVPTNIPLLITGKFVKSNIDTVTYTRPKGVK